MLEDEYKVMGLSSYGRPIYREWFKEIILSLLIVNIRLILMLWTIIVL